MSVKTLLIVDDEIKILDKLVTILSSEVESIITAINGQEALDKMALEPGISCVVSDINMPVMNGIDFVKEVRKKKNEVPFIFFTSHGDDNLVKEAVKYGAFDFVDKPHFGNLLSAVTRGMSQNFEAKEQSSDDPDSLVSEYEKLLGDF